jgi:hypothetical protein
MRMIALLPALVLTAAAGCGVLVHGTSQKILCTTSPPGALVKSAGGYECKTPCAVTLKRKNDVTLTIEREGYETMTLSIRSVISKYSAGEILLPGGLACWGIDLASGGGYRLTPDSVNVELKAHRSGRPVSRQAGTPRSDQFTPSPHIGICRYPDILIIVDFTDIFALYADRCTTRISESYRIASRSFQHKPDTFQQPDAMGYDGMQWGPWRSPLGPRDFLCP